jgi:hypothetical protein
MKVDFPQPLSAATPMTIGVCPSLRAICKDDELEADARRFDGTNADGVKALADAKTRAVTPATNFMVKSESILCVADGSSEDYMKVC